MLFKAKCPICNEEKEFSSPDDFWSCRDSLLSTSCPKGGCVVRERSIARAIFSIYTKESIEKLIVHEAAPTPRGITLLLREKAKRYIGTGYFPNVKFGAMVGNLRNEDLEKQTFDSDYFDMVIHLDVMEHLFNPFDALTEIYRTLKAGGFCFFTAPTEHNRFKSQQVAFSEEDKLRIIGEPEYHGNPQRPEDGALVTWRYGYDLPLQISRLTPFDDIEVRRYQSASSAVMGYMNEVYILKKKGN